MKVVLSAVLLATAFLCTWAADVSKGAALFKQHCATCHGDDAGGGKQDNAIRGVDLRGDAVQAHSDPELFDTIAYGKNHKKYMHAFVSRRVLGNADVAHLVGYIRQIGKKKSAS